MRDLAAAEGLALLLDEVSGRLRGAGGQTLAEPGVRTVADLRAVLATPAGAPDRRPCYYLYRDLHAGEQNPLPARYGLRYDITVTLPGVLGAEFMKTAGHTHSVMPGTDDTYPEIYEVLAGQALFLLQRVHLYGAARTAVAVVLVEARTGEVLLIPSNTEHVTVNIGQEPLVVADLIAVHATNSYAGLRVSRGAAYYICSPAGAGRYTVRANPRYSTVPVPRQYGSPAAAGLSAPGPLYRVLRGDPARYAFLSRPPSAVHGRGSGR